MLDESEVFVCIGNKLSAVLCYFARLYVILLITASGQAHNLLFTAKDLYCSID